MPLTHKDKYRRQVNTPSRPISGQKLSLGVISVSQGARHPSTLRFCCNFVEKPLLCVFLRKKQGGLRLNGVKPCMVAIMSVVYIYFFYIFCNLS